MDDFYLDQNKTHNLPKEQTYDDMEVPKRESPEEIVAENVSQQLFTNAFEFQKRDNESDIQLVPDSGHFQQTFGQPVVEEPFNQIDIQNEQRLSGFPIQQYIYDEEEEDDDEEEEDYALKMDVNPIEELTMSKESVPLSKSPKQSEITDNLFDVSNGQQNQPKEELLYHLSDDNVLTAQNYGIGSDLRIDSTSSDHNLLEGSVYELNNEDPFSTPQKHKPESDKQMEQDFERYVDKCEPFESITTDLEEPVEPMVRESINLLDLDQSVGQLSNKVLKEVSPKDAVPMAIESHSFVDSSPESDSEPEPEPNHALRNVVSAVESDKASEVLPSSAVDTELIESHIQSATEATNRSDTDFNPTQSPNLDSFEPTLTSSTHHFEQALPSQQQSSPPEPIETIEESPISPPISQIQSTQVFEPQEEPITVSESKMTKKNRQPEHEVTSNEADCPCGSGAWFNPNHMNPTVAELVYWRDPKKSGVVFGSGLVILLSLTVFSIISVVAYTSLAVLSVTLSFRIYKNILQAVQKTNEGHPFKDYLETEITPSSERIHEIVDSLIAHSNCTVNKLRSVFLVEDIIDSLKFVLLFWCLTYIGSWFNGLTLIILAYLGLFSVPKVYEMNKTQIDQYLSLASTQINDITSKIRAKMPFPAKKDKEN